MLGQHPPYAHMEGCAPCAAAAAGVAPPEPDRAVAATKWVAVGVVGALALGLLWVGQAMSRAEEELR